MGIKILTVLLIGLLKTDSVRHTEYCCSVCSPGSVHTFCKYPKPERGKACENYVRGPLTSSEKAVLLRKHNQLRQDIANGFKYFPPSANMMEMIWDDELEAIAKRWVDQCTFGHDGCRNSLRFSVGQNAAMLGVDDPSKTTKVLETVVQMWFDEWSRSPVNQVDNYTLEYPNGTNIEHDNYAISHFTQVIWANSYRVGCGIAITNPSPKSFSLTIPCNYGPAGNVINTRLYKSGKPCSSCPIGTSCSKEYPGLCKARCSKIQPQYCAGANSIKPFWKQKTRFIVLFVVYILSV